jgi:hypothetical protein
MCVPTTAGPFTTLAQEELQLSTLTSKLELLVVHARGGTNKKQFKFACEYAQLQVYQWRRKP